MSTEGSPSNLENNLGQLIELAERITTADGSTRTIIPYLIIDRHSHERPPIPCLLMPSFCLFLQGTKKLHFGKNIFYAHPGDFLASIIDLPGTSQVVQATKESPFIGLRIDFTTQEIASVMLSAGIKVKPKDKKLSTGAFIGKYNADFLELLIRLLKLTSKPAEAPFVSALIKQEMIFRLLSGDYGHLFFQQVLFDQQADGIGKAIAWIKENFKRSFTAHELASYTNMSVSGLQHKFKIITSMGPLQYQKQLRLQEARRLMLSGTMDATTAALEVGYESLSQFNREYRRQFGLPPLQDIKTVQKSASESLQPDSRSWS
ncbi:AraC family transcriptional regulator [Paenibacillus radicis (ex Gao et al. 2016)]|uniref:AraC family transcriptional regulator n=1 Tax=Paenibacillus radicis (ex Gao et al. 2016) TaxID=1737354 RepID=A0A917GW58_9BACL|nr:AraC family transcriptional regulator [Paenibacillus radicis (ex Gao et al. 2016)]GGG57936.1 AraC family transcriptional regulator [Paenibacillus radicis (ex Gao et al. 2016)]